MKTIKHIICLTALLLATVQGIHAQGQDALATRDQAEQSLARTGNRDRDNNATGSQSTAVQPSQGGAAAQGSPAQKPVIRRLPSEHGKTRVTAHLDTSRITIGGHTMLHIRVEGSGNRELIFQTPEQMTQGAVEALECVMDTTRDGKTIKAIEQTVTLTSFDSGEHHIVWLAVGVQDGGGYALISPGE